VVSVTPDRGLCGSVSAQVSRASKARIKILNGQGKKVMVLIYGEKARASLEKNFSQDFVATYGDHSKLKRRTFKQTLSLAQTLAAQPYESAEVLYNQFKNMLSFESRLVKLPSFTQATADPKLFQPYEIEGDAETLQKISMITLWLCDYIYG